MSKNLELRFPERHPGQEKIVDEAQRTNIVCCGRRFGKSTLGLDVLVTEPRGALDGYPVAWFAPNSKLFAEVWEEALRLLHPIAKHIDREQNAIQLITGGRIDFWTLHNTNDPARGRKYARTFIDEAAIVPSRRLEKQWQQAIRPTLTDYGGDAWFGSTPRGANYFKTLYDRAEAGEEGWKAWQMPTTTNPYIDPIEVEIARRELPPLVFAQEYMAEFVTEVGGAFKEPSRYSRDELPDKDYREATGCDFAYTSKSGDYTTFLRGRIHDGQVFLTDGFKARMEVNDWAPRLKQEPNPFAFIGGQEKGIVQMLDKQFGISISTKPATRDKLARAQPAIAAWNRGDIRVPNEAPWLDDFLPEILSFTGDDKIDDHDDAIDALAALYHALDGRSRVALKDLRRASGLGGTR